jgi:hypothetical protein
MARIGCREETQMEADFPAAHSMNVDWFAVDREGHVALFCSGSAGAVPRQADSDAGRERAAVQELTRLLEHSPGAGVAVHDLAGRTRPGPLGEQGRHHWMVRYGKDAENILLFLESLDPVREEVAQGRAVQLHATRGVAVFSRRLPGPLLQQLHKTGLCLGCFTHYVAEHEEDDPEAAAARLGLFLYTHPWGDAPAGPYGRAEQPQQAIHVDQLPPELRQLALRVRFEDLSFPRAPHIQPLEFTDCDTMGGAWLSQDGKTIRPVPGNDGDYRDEYEYYRNNPDLVVEPPPGHEEEEAAEGEGD